MSKPGRTDRKGKAGKSGKAKKSGKPGTPEPEAVAPGPDTAEPKPGGESAAPVNPAGQRLYDMPYSSPAPRLINPEIGLHNLVARAGHNAGYDIDLTLLDAPDHRLIRSGVVLAHRVLDGRGEWYLGAPDWVPLLPRELIEPMSQADLSDDLADLIRPFRRRAALGPVAALRCERREFALRDDHGTTLALLRDDKVTVRRGGLTTARYREVMLTPIGAGLTVEQIGYLDERLSYAGATPVRAFPRLVRRLGAPATGLTDFPEPAPFDPEAGFAQFVTQLMATRLHEVLRLDLELRAGQDPDVLGRLVEVLSRARTELGALRPLLDPHWVEDLYDELDWVITALTEEQDSGFDGRGRDRLLSRLRGERYLSLLDRLVSAARAAKVGPSGDAAAGQVLEDLSRTLLERIRRAADRLSVDAPVGLWDEAWRAFGQVAGVDDVARLVIGTGVGRHRDQLAEGQRLLGEIHASNRHATEVLDGVDELSASDAFDAGRQFERDRDLAHSVRADFVQLWGKARKKLLRG